MRVLTTPVSQRRWQWKNNWGDTGRYKHWFSCWLRSQHVPSGFAISIYIWLVVSNIFFIFHFILDNPSHWLSYFSEGWLNHQPAILLALTVVLMILCHALVDIPRRESQENYRICPVCFTNLGDINRSKNPCWSWSRFRSHTPTDLQFFVVRRKMSIHHRSSTYPLVI